MDHIRCDCCGNGFLDVYPYVGDYVKCECCGAFGYGTYDCHGYYCLEWYKDTEYEFCKTNSEI